MNISTISPTSFTSTNNLFSNTNLGSLQEQKEQDNNLLDLTESDDKQTILSQANEYLHPNTHDELFNIVAETQAGLSNASDIHDISHTIHSGVTAMKSLSDSSSLGFNSTVDNIEEYLTHNGAGGVSSEELLDMFGKNALMLAFVVMLLLASSNSDAIASLSNVISQGRDSGKKLSATQDALVSLKGVLPIGDGSVKSLVDALNGNQVTPEQKDALVRLKTLVTPTQKDSSGKLVYQESDLTDWQNSINQIFQSAGSKESVNIIADGKIKVNAIDSTINSITNVIASVNQLTQDQGAILQVLTQKTTDYMTCANNIRQTLKEATQVILR